MYSFLFLLLTGICVVSSFPTSDQENSNELENVDLRDSSEDTFPLNTDVASEGEGRCPFKEVWSECYAHCQHNCSNWGRRIPCPKNCVPGCICRDEFVRDKDGGRCEFPNACGKGVQQYFPDEEQHTDTILDRHGSCPDAEHWDDCFAHCQHSCSTWGVKISCPKPCEAGCVCDDGYVRGPDGKCVRPNNCAELQHYFADEKRHDYFCPKHQHFSWCRALCEKNCTNYDKPVPCPYICASGCVCDTGYVRDVDRKCVPESKCPSKDSSDIQTVLDDEDEFCPPNEQFSECHAHCQHNCSNWSDATVQCAKICVPGCVCKNGMVRGPHGNCISPRKCPSRDMLDDQLQVEYECPVDEHFTTCGAQCQRNCTNWNKSVKCSSECYSGCVCDESYVRGPTGKCTKPHQCPSLLESIKNKMKKEDFCPENEHHSKYRALPDSKIHCIDEFDDFHFCPPTFLNGCVCSKGLVRGPGDECVDSRTLPNANELHFMRDSDEDCDHTPTYDSERTAKDDNVLKFLEPLKNGKEDTIKLELDSTTDSEEMESEIDENSSTDFDISKGVLLNEKPPVCPDRRECYFHCRHDGYKDGICWGSDFSRCFCW